MARVQTIRREQELATAKTAPGKTEKK